MDDYSRATIALLLERNRQYLSELVGTKIPEGATVDTVCNLILASHNSVKETFHVSSIYRCKCGSRMVIVREVQLRSSDEGSTIVHVCNKCGNMW